jgi:aspartyl-tRNA(Asn)/glutamyl-tRNA(Gln) amidotransferase subunit C
MPASLRNSPPVPEPRIDVRHVALLARLELDEEEVGKFQHQLDQVVADIARLGELDLTGVEPTAHAVPVFDRMREDIPGESLPCEEVISNAPDHFQNQIRVPRVVADA